MAQEILVSINVSSGKAQVNLDSTKKSVDKLAAAQKRLKEAESATAIEIAKVNLQTKEQIAVNNQAAAALLKNTKTGSKQFRTQVGLNNAILQEAGRAASDARFGFNGVANNVGQLASLFGSLINTSDNVSTSLKNLGKSLLGTGGLLIAIQLLIAYGDRIYAFFFETDAAANKLKSTMEGLVKPIKENRLELLGYVEVLNDVTSSEAARLEAMDAISDAVPNSIDENGDLKLSYKELKDSVEDYIEQLTIRAEIEAIVELNSEKFSKRRKLRDIDAIDDADERRSTIEKLIEEESNFYDGVLVGSEVMRARSLVAKDAAENDVRTEEQKNKDLLENLDKFNKDVANADSKRIKIKGQTAEDVSKQTKEQTEKDFKTLLKASEIEADAILKSVTELQKRLKGSRNDDDGGNGRSSSFKRRLKAFIAGQKNYEKETEKSQKRLLDMFTKDEKARVINANQTKIELLRINQEQFKERQKARLAAYTKERNDDIEAENKRIEFEKSKKDPDEARIKASRDRIIELNAAKVQATEDSNREIEDSEKSLSKAIVAINKETNTKLNNIDLERARNVQKLNQESLIAEAKFQDQLTGLPKIFQDKERNERIKQLTFQLTQNQIELNGFTGTEEEKQRLIIETFNLRNELSKLNQESEKARFEQIKEIYTDGFSTVTNTATAFANIQTNNLEDEYRKRIDAAKGNTQAQARLEQELAEKKDKIARKQFKIDQVAKISKALMDTYQAAGLAYGSQMQIGEPTSPIRAAIAKAVAIASGLANVALIASQKYQSPNRAGTGSTAASTSAPPVQIQAPEFNVVGASETNQLAEAVAGKTQEPVKAYVSIKDVINTNNEFDRNVNRGSVG